MKKSDKDAAINAIYFFMGKATQNKDSFTYSSIKYNDVLAILYKLLKYFPEEFIVMYAKHPVCLQVGVIADIEGTILSIVKEY